MTTPPPADDPAWAPVGDVASAPAGDVASAPVDNAVPATADGTGPATADGTDVVAADGADVVAAETAPARRRRRGWRILWWTLGTIVALLITALVGVLVWSQLGVMAAEPDPLAAVQADPAITITEHPEGIVLAPSTGASTVGLVYIPGAKVDPWAYAAKMSGVVAEDDVTVVITKPWLNLAFFDLRPLSTFTNLAPGVGAWMVGGHSLGGVKACQLASDAKALVLFGSYCANDLSRSGLPVLSIAGSEDGLSTPEKIADARRLLPADAQLVEILGAGHASFGDYGPQPGDGDPTISDAAMTARLTELVGRFAAFVAR